MQPGIKIYGAKTLQRYTDQILKRGFRNKGWHILSDEQNGALLAHIYQIHGSPEAIKQDKKLLEEIQINLATTNDERLAILLHRPDEIKDRFPELNSILGSNKKNITLVFLGSRVLFTNSDSLTSRVKKAIIPHGFFSDLSKPNVKEGPVIIGSHTTWGEMRSTEHALKLINHLLMNNTDKKVIGYLGGKPAEELGLDLLKQIAHKINLDSEIKFIDFDSTISIEQLPDKSVVINKTGVQPTNLVPHFNIQMYYYGNQVRMGESSGSAHASTGIPVILEMNNSEEIEGLKVIKVPYENPHDITTIDFEKGAAIIHKAISANSYIEMIENNEIQANKFDCNYVAEAYINLFHSFVEPEDLSRFS